MTAFVLGVLAMAGVVLTPVEVVATAYSCENHPDNRMHPCNTTRWGNDPHLPGIAAPPEWRAATLYVPRYGVLVVDDTGRYHTLNIDGTERVHVDIRMSTYDAAIRYGIRRVVVYRVEYSPLYATKGERYEQ